MLYSVTLEDAKISLEIQTIANAQNAFKKELAGLRASKTVHVLNASSGCENQV